MHTDSHSAANDAAVLLTRAQAAARLSLSVKTLHNLASAGDGPPFLYITPRSPRYRVADLDAWIESRRVAHTTEGDAKGFTPRGRRRLAAQRENV